MDSSIVTSAAQQLGNLMVEEAKYLYNVRDKIENLQMELAWMDCFLRDADNQQHQDKLVSMWVSHVRDLAYDAEDIIEKYLHGVRHHRLDGVRNTLNWFSGILCSSDARTLHSLGSEIDNLTLKMSELTKRLKRYGIQIIKSTNTSVEYNTVMREERRTYSHTTEVDVVGLDKDIQQVVDQLLDKTQLVKVVAISGVGGLGKTTLARKVFKHKHIQDHFNDNCAWVYISKEFDSKTVFQEILRQLEKGNDNANKTIEQLAEEIDKVLQGKRSLVVVDDIWTVEAWERLKPAFDSIFTTASSTSFSKILLTTRTTDLVKRVDPNFGYLHSLKTLSEDDSWELLKRKAFDRITDDDRPRMEILGKEMLKHCDGLPIAILTIRGILSTKNTLSEWKDVQTNISSYLMGRMELENTNNRLFKILELSYNELPFYLKPCFLYLGNFPEDYEIPAHKLYHLWEAEGFLALEGEVQKKGGTSYDIGERYLNELVQRSMVLVRNWWPSGRIKTCQVHDVIRDMCLRKCGEVGFLSHIGCKKSGMVYGLPPFSVEIKKLRRCILLGEDRVDEDFQFGENGTSLRSLLVFNANITTMRKIWKSCPLLRVLDLQDLKDLRSLYGMKCLIHLRYFSLRGSRIGEIPSCVFDLQYIETLDLRRHWYSSQYYTLSNKFYKMKRLRHLYLPRNFKVRDGSKLRFPSGGQMETIKNLDPSRCEAEELLQMTNLMVFSITKNYIFEKAEELKWVVEAPLMKKQGQLINTFRIRIEEGVIKGNLLILRPLEHHPSCFKELKIFGTPGKHVKKKGNSIIFPESLTRVELKDCDTSVEGGLLLDLEKLPHLQVLTLEDSTIGEAINKLSFSPHGFPQLTEFSTRDSSISFVEWEVGEAAAPNLQVLYLGMCENLNKLKNIPNSLTRVVLWSCGVTQGDFSALERLPYLKSLSVREATMDMKLLSFSAASFPQLTILHLSSLSELEEWEVGEGALANLQSLRLQFLQRLKKVVMNELPHGLTRVELDYCDILGEEGHVSLLDCLKKLPQLQKLEMSGRVRSATGGGGNKLTFSPGDFPQLPQLDLIWLPGLMEWEVGDGALPKLQELMLRECKRLNKLNNLPNSLIRVDLYECEIGEAAGGVLLLALEKLPCLQELYICRPMIGGNKVSFSAGSFPQLTQLAIVYAKELMQWEVGDGALPNLQRLKLRGCNKLKKLPEGLRLPNLQCLDLYECNNLEKLPEGLPDSVHIECKKPCIKGIEKYNSCPHFKKSRWRLKPMWWLRDSCP